MSIKTPSMASLPYFIFIQSFNLKLMAKCRNKRQILKNVKTEVSDNLNVAQKNAPDKL